MTRSDVTRSSLFGRNRVATIGPFLFTLLILSACAMTGGPSHLLTDVVDVKAGERHTCVLTSAGGVKCWGFNHDGQLGDGKQSDRSIPVNVVGLASGAKTITAGWRHSCAITSLGGIQCWGNNHDGQVGDGSETDRKTPQDVVGLMTRVTAVAAGERHTCALTTTGGVKCWGNNHDGELGDGTKKDRITPVDVVGLTTGVTAITTGWRHACALTTAGGVKCWGNNHDGQLGDGTEEGGLTPVDVSGLTSGVTAIAARGRYTCALTSVGGVKCWGNNHDGQLGDGTRTDRNAPVDVTGLTSGVKAIATGWRHSCALMTAGGMTCWGNNHDGELGDGTGVDKKTPVDVMVVSSGIIAIAAGGQHTCALVKGTVVCWGENEDGQLGDGTYKSTLANKAEPGG
ncbi:MAG: RCC1 domain-containing protein [Nitrospiraceae bacterium]